jgi:flavin-dependent dehydrogenase
VRGVRTDHADPALQSLSADLVVDCSGRGSRSLKFLAEHGIEAPPKQRVAAFVGYSSRLYRAPAEASASWWKGILVHEAFPEHPGFGILAPVERGLWLVTAGGYNRSYPPSDDAEFVAFLRGLRSPVIAEAIAGAEPITPISHTRATDNLWNEAHRWPAAPRGFLLMGDALCAPNPAHGQGITKASVEALLLDAHLSRRARDFEPAFRRAQARWAQRIWNVATLLDLRWSNAEGARPWYLGAVQWASKLMLHASHLDRAVFKVSAGVYQFVLPDLALVRPGILARVLLALLRSQPRLPAGDAESVPGLASEAPP